MPEQLIRSKREALRVLLVEGITSGRHPAGSRLPSEPVLARTCGVSRDTVRSVLDALARSGMIIRRRGSGTWVAEDAERRLGATAVVAALRVALILQPDRLGNPIHLGIISAFLARLPAEARAALIIRDAPTAADADGFDLLLCDGSYPAPLVAALAATGRPLVLLNRQHDELPFVCTDNRAGGVLVAEHALALGHRRVCLVHFGERGTEADFIHRLRGMRHALRASGCEPDEVELDLHRRVAFDAVAWLQRSARGGGVPSAFLCVTDGLALRAIEVLQRHGLAVPEAAGVSGFDDLAISALVTPGLTTVRQPLAELGAALAEAVVARLAGRALALHRPLRPILVPRATLAACSARTVH